MNSGNFISSSLKEKRSLAEAGCTCPNFRLLEPLMSSIRSILKDAGLSLCLFFPLQVGALHLTAALQPVHFLGTCIDVLFLQFEVAHKIASDLSMSVYAEMDSHFGHKHRFQTLAPGLGIQWRYALTRTGFLQASCTTGIARAPQMSLGIYSQTGTVHGVKSLRKTTQLFKARALQVSSTTGDIEKQICSAEGDPPCDSLQCMSELAQAPNGKDDVVVSKDFALKTLETYLSNAKKVLEKLVPLKEARIKESSLSYFAYRYEQGLDQASKLKEMIRKMQDKLKLENAGIENLYELPNFWANTYYLRELLVPVGKKVGLSTNLIKFSELLASITEEPIEILSLISRTIGEQEASIDLSNHPFFSQKSIESWCTKLSEMQKDPAALFANYYWKKWLNCLALNPKYVCPDKDFEKRLHLEAYGEYAFSEKLDRLYASKQQGSVQEKTDQIDLEATLSEHTLKNIDESGALIFEKRNKKFIEEKKMALEEVKRKKDEIIEEILRVGEELEERDRQKISSWREAAILDMELRRKNILSSLKTFEKRSNF